MGKSGVVWLAGAFVEPSVLDLRPDYSAVIVAAEGLRPGPTDSASEGLLAAAESSGRALLRQVQLEDVPEVADWREAYRGFGAKPQRTRPSVEALLRRVDAGLPRIDRLTDVYNALSVRRLLPVGGEDLESYEGPARLVRADGTEPFDTLKDGEEVVEHPLPGEVVWRDDAGVTCRMWNWRQCRRTRITEGTTTAMFVLDGLGSLGRDGLAAARDELLGDLASLNPGAELVSRTLP